MAKLQVFGNNSKTVSNIKNLTWGKNDQHIKIYLPCNVDLDMLRMFAVSTYHLSVIVFEIKDEKY
jgi:hypothetical protein